ncbi:hypothetical protein TVAG_259210 [Trichomonas vaginalis G3]|uniref:Uncharacterized protein n=1 Tax=Trichomonas vaginalis (strain ATCC PRA-98 / G3) TaxID=412133 RepID=A2EBX2_TRIV3|nr:TAG-278-related family [Trichomonas vaginalis G3]EAY09840.1 hypothetical protein TVAG_259210 [Trichomonas vaginalis G3]KAI5505930.1 TAG-278-related family [Trichomonas vaginalis G3]|eukprot:XP_001322063.1 hypothetical protein [Trichomonas vaginalis G3]
MDIDYARQFNVCKKTAKLAQAISDFQYRIQKINFEKQVLFNDVDKILNKASDEYKNNMDKIYNDAKSTHDNANNANQIQLQKKFENLVSTYKNNTESIQNNLNSYMKTLQLSIAKLSESIPKNLKSKQETNEIITKMIYKSKKNIENNVNILNETQQKELKEVEIESDKKLQLFKANSRVRIEQLRVDHNKLIEELKNQQKNVKISPNFLKKLENYKEICSQTRDLNDKAAQNIILLQSSFSLFMNQKKILFNEMIQRVFHAVDHSKEIEYMKNELNNNKQSYILIEENLKNELKKKNELFQSILEDLHKQLSDQLTNYNNLIVNYSNSAKNFDSSYIELKNSLEQEKTQLIDEISSNEKELTSKNEKINSKILDFSKSSKKERKLNKKVLLETKKSNNTEKETKEKDFAFEISEKTKIINNSEQNLRNDINKLRNQSKADNKVQLQTLDALNEEKKANLENYEFKLKTIQDETERVISNLNLQIKKEENDLVFNQNQEFKTKFAENQQKLLKLEEELKVKEVEAIKQCNESYNSKIFEIKSKNNFENEIKSENDEYKSIYNDLQKQLKSLQATNPEKEQIFKKSNEEIEKFQSMIEEYKKIIVSERGLLSNFYENAFKNEIERHQNSNRPKSSGRAREQVRKSLQSKIEETKAKTIEETQKLEEFLKILENNFKNQLENGQNTINSIVNSMDYNENQLIYQKQLENSENLANLAEKRSKQEISDYKHQNEEQIKEIESKILNLTENLKNPNLDFSKFTEKLMTIRSANERAYEQIKQSLKRNIDVVFDSATLETKKLFEKYQEIEKKKQRILSESMEMMKRKEIENETFMRSLMNRLSKELIKIQMKNKEKIEKFDEKIESLEKDLNQLSSTFDLSRPRPCDLERIKYLQEDLKSKVSVLRIMSKEFSQYKSMIEKQEKDFNARFGFNLKAFA